MRLFLSLFLSYLQAEKSLTKDLTKFFGVQGRIPAENSTLSKNKGSPPDFLVSLYEQLKTLDTQESQQKVLSDGNTVRVIYPFKAEEENDEGVWVYDVSELPAQEKIVTSEFRAQMSDRPEFKSKLLRKSNKINVRIMKKFTPESYQFDFELEKETSLSPRNDIWSSSEVENLVKLSREPGHVLTAKISSLSKSQRITPLLVVYSNDVHQTESLKKPLEEIVRRKRSEIPKENILSEKSRKESRSSRRKKSKRCKSERLSRRKNKKHRSRKECRRYEKLESQEKAKKMARSVRCGRRSLHIDFNEIGWSSWIIQPMNFDAYYCGGFCGYNEVKDMRKSNHAILQAIMNRFDPDVPLPCCVPEKMMPLSILFTDHQNHIVLKVYPEMSVKTCSCR